MTEKTRLLAEESSEPIDTDLMREQPEQRKQLPSAEEADCLEGRGFPDTGRNQRHRGRNAGIRERPTSRGFRAEFKR